MNFGGQELRIIMEMEGLKKYGFDSVLACRPNSRISLLAKNKGLKYYELPFKTTFDFFSMRRLLGIIKKHRVEIVNSHSSKDGWNSAMICKLLGIPFVRSRHIGLQVRPHKIGKMIYTTFPDRVLVTGKYIEDMLVKHDVKPDKIARIPTGINIDRFAGPKNPQFRKEFGIDNDTPLVGYVSVVRADKGPHYFIKCIQHVLNRIKKVKFVMVGDGRSYQDIRLLIDELRLHEHVFLTGHRDDIDIVMKGIDLFVLPAVVPEGVPQAVLQAFASGVPVVATDVGGVNEVAIDGESALLVKPRDPEGLADAIVYLLENRDVALRLAEAGRRSVAEYTLDGMLLKMKIFYEELKR
jgi:glycosyltransferase involved in cell wall biosynthesis